MRAGPRGAVYQARCAGGQDQKLEWTCCLPWSVQLVLAPAAPSKRFFFFPGGHAEPGDNGQDKATAAREALEEVGLDLSEGYDFVGVLSDRSVFQTRNVLNHNRMRIGICAGRLDAA